MATAGGAILLGDLRLHESFHARIVSHESFLPSSSHVCTSRVRGRCVWAGRSRASGTRASVSVQLREAGSVSEILLEEIAQELYSEKENSPHERSSHGNAEPAMASSHSEDVLDRSMASYIQTISALKEQRSSLEPDEPPHTSSQLMNSVAEEAIKTMGRRSIREANTMKQKQETRGSAPKPNGRTKNSKYVSISVRESKQRTIALVKAIDALQQKTPVHHILSNSDLSFTSRESSFILNGLKKDHDKTLDVFKWLHEAGKTRGNVYCYNIVLKILGARQEWPRIDALLLQMEADSCSPDDYTFNTLIMSASKADCVDHATEYFHSMLQNHVTPTRLTYSMMMLLYQKHGRVPEAEVVFSHMLQSGIQVVAAYSAMIATYTREGHFEKSEQIMKEMLSLEIAPDRDNWLKQLNTYGQQGKIEQAEHVMDTVKKLGMSLGIVGYNSMITAYGKAGLYEKASRLVEEMREQELEPDEVTYSCMIGACGRAGKLKDALCFFEELKRLKITPRSSNFNTLVSLYGKSGNVVGIVRVIADMKRLGCKPDWQTLDAVVRAYDRSGQIKKVTQVLSLLRDAGFVEETTCYGTLLHVYLKCNLQKKAFSVFLSMRKAGMAPKEYMCRSLICACKEAGMFEDAVYVFREMQVAGVVPSLESSCTMINIYGLKSDVKQAAALFLLLRSKIERLDIIAYNVMINVYMRFEMHEEAIRVYKLLQEEDKLLADSYTFHSMLRLCQKCNLREQAEEVYWTLRHSNVEMDEVMCNCVLNTCARFLPLEEVHRVFQEMIDDGFAPNNITFNVMIDLYGKAGLMDR
jgi:pentatricopeptide repeat protein